MSFDATMDGTSARLWTSDERYSEGRALDLSALQGAGLSRIVVVAPHPDDETLGAGALIAECAARGIEVLVIVVTDGSASHHGRPDLADVRRAELLRAVEILAPEATVYFLGITDGQVQENREIATAALAAALLDAGAETLVVAPWPGDGHRDHRIVGELCAELSQHSSLQLIYYPIWMWHWGTPTDPRVPWSRFRRLRPAAASLDRKRRALREFDSQLGTVLLESFIQHFTGDTEIFMTPTPPETRLESSYFDELYERHTDPWKFETRWYERRKRALTMAALPAENFRNALEIGCSIGTLTELLADRCDALLAIDISHAAVERAQERLVRRPTVTVLLADAAEEFPAGEYDLIVMSEVAYYFDESTLALVLADVLDHLSEAGFLVACHWLHEVAEYPLDGESVHAALRALPGLICTVTHREDDFILEVFCRDGRSVAEREGLVE